MCVLCLRYRYAPQLAQTYRNILEWQEEYFEELTCKGLELELAEFAPSLDPDAKLTIANRDEAVLEACRHKLLGCREPALAALRNGFALQPNEGASAAAGKHALDLLPLLQLFDPPQLALLIGGRSALDAPTLLASMDWSSSSLHAGGFVEPPQLRVPAMLRRLLADENVFTPERRLHFFKWVTGRAALPMGGLEQKIELRLEDSTSAGMVSGGAGDEGTHTQAQADARLPRVQTCFHALYLPLYSSAAVLRQRLLLALEHRDDGFHLQ